jgi:hypothetical protein
VWAKEVGAVGKYYQKTAPDMENHLELPPAKDGTTEGGTRAYQLNAGNGRPMINNE